MNVSVPSFGRVFFIWKLVSGSDFSFCIIASYAYLPIDVWQTEYGDGVICVYSGGVETSTYVLIILGWMSSVRY